MAEKKRWIAMYTKHIKQKRKVYHDGFLDLQITRRKVLLYDEEDNLLESRMLKADEVVSTGESLTFQAHLVDICEPKDGSKPRPLSDPKVQPSDQGCGRKPFAVLRPNFKKSSLHSEEKKPNTGNKFPSKSLSPSPKMIRVFKKRQLHKYEALSPDNVKPTTQGGTLPLGSAHKGSNNHSLINSPCDGRSGTENDKLSKDVPPHKPLRDVNQILSILQRPNDIDTSSDSNLKASTKIPPESDSSKKQKMESVSSRGNSRIVISTFSQNKLKYTRKQIYCYSYLTSQTFLLLIGVAASSKDSLPQQFMVQETSTASTTVRSMTHLNDPPSFDLGI